MKYEKKPISDILRLKQTVFTFKDISLIWGKTDKRSLISSINYYVKTGGLYRIRRGIYSKDKNYNRLELATRIYTPAYLSFETVLKQAGIVFQYYKIIFVASYLSREITCDGQKYSFKKIKDSILSNPAGVEHKKGYAIATPERAFLDRLYISKDYYFDSLLSLDWDKVFEMLPIYGNKRMIKKVNEIYKKFKEK